VIFIQKCQVQLLNQVYSLPFALHFDSGAQLCQSYIKVLKSNRGHQEGYGELTENSLIQ